jgi:hypothetical protein
MSARLTVAGTTILLVAACSVFGSVQGEYTPLAGGTASGGGGATSTGGGGTGGVPNRPPWSVSINGEVETHITDVVVRNNQVYAVGWFVGDALRIDGIDPLPASNNDDDQLPDAFFVHLDASGNVLYADVYDHPGTDKLYGVDVLPNGDILLAGQCCASKSFDSAGADCVSGPRGCVAQLRGSDYVVRDVLKFGDTISGAKAVRALDDDTAIVAAETKLVTSMQDVVGCDTDYEATLGSLSYGLAMLTLNLDAAISCGASIRRWELGSEVTALAIDPLGRHLVTGQFEGPSNLDDTQTSWQTEVAYSAILDGGTQTVSLYNGASADVAHDVAVHPDGGRVTVGRITNGTTGLPSTAPTPGAGFIIRHDEANSELWSLLLSENGGSDAEATAVTTFESAAFVVGSFAFEDRIFGSMTLSAVGARDMFLVAVDESGELFLAESFGANAASVTPTGIAILESVPLVIGDSTSTFDTSAGTVTCAGSNSTSCAFIQRLPFSQ